MQRDEGGVLKKRITSVEKLRDIFWNYTIEHYDLG